MEKNEYLPGSARDRFDFLLGRVDVCELMEARINETIRDEEGRSTLADILVDPYAEETSWDAISHYEYVEMYKALYDCSRRNRSFLEYLYGFVDGVFHKNYDSARH